MTIRITGDGPKITATGSGSTVLVEISTGQHDPGSFSGVHNDLAGRSTSGAHVGTAVSIDPSGFAGNLDGTITNAQLLAAAVDDLTTGGGGGGGASLSDTTPQALGTAAAGTGTAAARDDHVHDMPTAADVGADASGAAQAVADSLGGAAVLDVGTTTGTVAAGDDARLSDARTPTAHNHAASEVTSGTLDIGRIPTGTTSTTVPFGNDSRITGAVQSTRTVNGHALSADVTITASDVGAQPADSDLTTIAGLTATTDSFIQAKSSAWAARTIAQVKTDLGVPLNYVAPRVTGEWYSTRGPVATAVLGGTNATTGRIQCIPVYLHAGTIDRIGVYTTSAGSGTTWRLGIYPSGTDGLPDGQARLIDAGTVDMGATAGLLAITISQSIATAGLYWLVCLSDAYSANPTVYAWNAQSMPIQELEGIPTSFASNPERSGWMRTATGVTTGSIPSTCPTLAWANSGPKIAVRAA